MSKIAKPFGANAGESGEQIVAGYMIIEAQDLERALELAKGCPILEAGGSVEVRPIPGMVE
jgi:hypothetical protein